ncbi:MAG: glycosyltransferase, partial [Actinomycetes bacterium]
MSATDPTDRRLLLGAEGPEDDGSGEALAPPPVVVVLVVDDAEPLRDHTLGSLAAQDYPNLGVLVVDPGSDDLDLVGRVARAMPDAGVQRVRALGFAEAANAAAAVPEPPAYWCFCRHDVVLAPDAVRILVEEAYRSNAAIVGPKLVDLVDPEVLVDVGRAIDRFGGAHTGIEPGELDQEQHDSVRDVFYVSDAVMLVRADLFAALGGFDAETDPGSEDLDLCWRARLAGARVMVVPDARAGLPVVPLGARSRAEVRERARLRVRTVFTCYSAASLAWIVPIALVGSLLEALAFMFSRRRVEAFADIRAWWWNLVHVRRVRRARRRAQQRRTIPDSDLRELQLGWSERLQSFLAHHHADERVESIGDRMRATADGVFAALRHPGTVAFAAFLGLFALGSRMLIDQGVPAVGDLVPWTSVGSMFTAYGSAWRNTGLGAPRAASAALGAMGTLTAVTFDHPGLARTALVLGVFAVGPLGVSRLLRRLGVGRGPAMAAAVLYGITPVARNALAEGRLGPLVLFGCAPYLVLSLARVAGFADVEARSGRWRAPLGLVVSVAVATAFWPPAVGFVVLVAVATATETTRPRSARQRPLRASTSAN